MLRQRLDFLVHRYLLATIRQQSSEKAEIHVDISEVLFEFINCRCKHGYCDSEAILDIHDRLSVITNHMTVYGLDMNTLEPQDLTPVVTKVINAIIIMLKQGKLNG